MLSFAVRQKIGPFPHLVERHLLLHIPVSTKLGFKKILNKTFHPAFSRIRIGKAKLDLQLSMRLTRKVEYLIAIIMHRTNI